MSSDLPTYSRYELQVLVEDLERDLARLGGQLDRQIDARKTGWSMHFKGAKNAGAVNPAARLAQLADPNLVLQLAAQLLAVLPCETFDQADAAELEGQESLL